MSLSITAISSDLPDIELIRTSQNKLNFDYLHFIFIHTTNDYATAHVTAPLLHIIALYGYRKITVPLNMYAINLKVLEK